MCSGCDASAIETAAGLREAAETTLRQAWAQWQARPSQPAQAPIKSIPAVLSTPIKAPNDNRRWCEQCEQRVSLTAASFCKNKFCKVRPALSARG